MDLGYEDQAVRKQDAAGIMIMGPSGSGKTTLGKALARELRYQFVDIDDYIWKKDTEIPFSEMYSREEKINRLMEAIKDCGHFVMAGSMDSFHEYFDPYFRIVVFLDADTELRVKRVHERETKQFGSRIQDGGDMYEEHQKYLKDIAGYRYGYGGCTLQQHEAWLASLSCRILRLDGANAPEYNVKCILDGMQEKVQIEAERKEDENYKFRTFLKEHAVEEELDD